MSLIFPGYFNCIYLISVSSSLLFPSLSITSTFDCSSFHESRPNLLYIYICLAFILLSNCPLAVQVSAQYTSVEYTSHLTTLVPARIHVKILEHLPAEPKATLHFRVS